MAKVTPSPPLPSPPLPTCRIANTQLPGYLMRFAIDHRPAQFCIDLPEFFRELALKRDDLLAASLQDLGPLGRRSA